jgi:hypothetical protein
MVHLFSSVSLPAGARTLRGKTPKAGIRVADISVNGQ